MNISLNRPWRVLIAVTLVAATLQLQAQETVNKDLDACIRHKKITMTLKGAAIGGLTGLAASFLGKPKSKNVITNVAIGAVAGGAIGYATAYFKAADNCLKENPSWVPESKIERSKDYAETVQEYGYDRKHGNLIKISKIEMVSTAKPGETIDINAYFVVLTPNGEESKVNIERKLFAIADGKEELIPFLGRTREERTVEAGEQIDKSQLPIPSDAPVGVAYRIEYLLSADDQTPSQASATVTVN